MIFRRLLYVAAVLALFAGLVLGAHQLLTPRGEGLAGMMPDGALFYIETPDFHSLLSDWMNSPQQQAWLKSDNYAVFSNSRLFGRLSQAQTEFASAAGLPPDMQFVSQMAGKESAFAWYDIGNLEFLYISHLPSASFSQSTLWQSRGKFESRQSGKHDFYVRTDSQSQRTVAFASVDDWVILGTRQDLVAGALALIGGAQTRTIHDEPWYADSLAAARDPSDLRMVLNLEKIVPSPYFRSYWIQQNITEMKQYRAAISDLYRSKQAYTEERVLLRKNVADVTPASSDISHLTAAVPADTGFYKAIATPSSKQTVETLRDKLLDPRSQTEANYTYAPPAPVTDQMIGHASDLETRIDQAPAEPRRADPWQPLVSTIDAAQVNGLLICESSALQNETPFVRFSSAVVLVAEHDWNLDQLKSTLSATLEPQISSARLGLGWTDRQDYSEFDGLLTLALYVRGKYLILSNNPSLLLTVEKQLGSKPASSSPVVYASGFNHIQEGNNFRRITTFIDRAGMRGSSSESNNPNEPRQPAFFSGNVAGFSQVVSGVTSESVIVRNDGQNVKQTVTYQW